jgi:hypothetical protein
MKADSLPKKRRIGFQAGKYEYSSYQKRGQIPCPNAVSLAKIQSSPHLRDLGCGIGKFHKTTAHKILSCLLEIIYDKNKEQRGYSPQERVNL